MKKTLWSRLLIISVFFSLLMSGCKDEEDTNYVFTGKVIDQVTRQPVSGATIWYGHRQFNEGDHPVGKMHQSAMSSADGRFTLVVPKEIFDDQIRNPGPVIFAEDSAYVGSNLINATQGGENLEIEFYHSSQLSIHIQNDTITNQIDEIQLWIVGDRDFWTYPGFSERIIQGMFPVTKFNFKGRDFDTVFIIKPLWGNLTYSLHGGKSYFFGPYYFSNSINLIPDTINYISLSF